MSNITNSITIDGKTISVGNIVTGISNQNQEKIYGRVKYIREILGGGIVVDIENAGCVRNSFAHNVEVQAAA